MANDLVVIAHSHATGERLFAWRIYLIRGDRSESYSIVRVAKDGTYQATPESSFIGSGWSTKYPCKQGSWRWVYGIQTLPTYFKMALNKDLLNTCELGHPVTFTADRVSCKFPNDTIHIGATTTVHSEPEPEHWPMMPVVPTPTPTPTPTPAPAIVSDETTQAIFSALQGAIRQNVEAVKVVDMRVGTLETNEKAIKKSLESIVGSIESLSVITKAFQDAQPRVTNIIIGSAPPVQIPATAHYLTPTLVKYLAAKVNVFIVGPAGSGKTYATKVAADILGQNHYLQACDQDIGRAQILGFMSIGTGKWVPGSVYEPYKNGGIYVVDELDTAEAGAAVALNSILVNSNFRFDNNEIVEKHDDLMAIATANTWGHGATNEYVSGQRLDGRTLNRFAFLYWPYDEKAEFSWVMPGYEDWVRFVQQFRKAVAAHKAEYIISPRSSINGAKLSAAGVTWPEICEATLYQGMTPTDRERINNSCLASNPNAFRRFTQNA